MFTEREKRIIALAHSIIARRFTRLDSLNSPEMVVEYLKTRFAILEHETFAMILLDNQHRVINAVDLSHGTIDSAAVYPREVVKTALKHNAAAVILAHNHPSGVAEPSRADRQITERLQAALDLVDIRVLDHIVVAGENSMSFAERGLI
ncbi:TPA: DNA repair protein RadC [Aeromonas salmonicida]|uniref:RadC family protein n=1 Tax=Aeromonas salmonicida TaxID=645 RepID=UPI00045335B0|nr:MULTISPECIES: DNA repair protein RadC [Aeromonas]BDT52217.1 DNA repair protein [Aeromonas caviae]ATD40542.1 DNA repair protein [Aeromonas salmonicida subsp. masoucida]QOI95869.1 DNA repair protein RadC [Aeromonas salmonicida subsp. masoucida]QYH28520.1 DNA repair protein RadC [Aeromonas salmonicida subsp. masoucida]WGI41246.1 DNA repair protein RadC [Aeromonas salmonicida]